MRHFLFAIAAAGILFFAGRATADPATEPSTTQPAAPSQPALSFADLTPAMIGMRVRVHTNSEQYGGFAAKPPKGHISFDEPGHLLVCEGTLAELHADRLLIRSIPPTSRMEIQRKNVTFVELLEQPNDRQPATTQPAPVAPPTTAPVSALLTSDHPLWTICDRYLINGRPWRIVQTNPREEGKLEEIPFEVQYSLRDREVLRWVQPWPNDQSFTSYRKEYIGTKYHGSPNPPPVKTLVFTWDGKLHRQVLQLHDISLGGVLESVIGLHRDDYVMPNVALWSDMGGDWIVRDGTTVEDKLNAFAGILSGHFEEPIRFAKRDGKWYLQSEAFGSLLPAEAKGPAPATQPVLQEWQSLSAGAKSPTFHWPISLRGEERLMRGWVVLRADGAIDASMGFGPDNSDGPPSQEIQAQLRDTGKFMELYDSDTRTALTWPTKPPQADKFRMRVLPMDRPLALHHDRYVVLLEGQWLLNGRVVMTARLGARVWMRHEPTDHKEEAAALTSVMPIAGAGDQIPAMSPPDTAPTTQPAIAPAGAMQPDSPTSRPVRFDAADW